MTDVSQTPALEYEAELGDYFALLKPRVMQLVVFTAVEPHQQNPDGTLKRDKVIRNRFYKICGGLMILSILAMASYAALAKLTSLDLSWWSRANMTFWFEALALWGFGLSWMVKGRFWGTMLQDEIERAI